MAMANATSRKLAAASRGSLLTTVATLLLGGCDVTNPGAILDDSLYTEVTLPALVAGMSADFSEWVGGSSFVIGCGSDELTASHSDAYRDWLRDGRIGRQFFGRSWNFAHRARWVAEDGVRRMRTVLGPDGTGSYDGHPLVVRAFLFAALAQVRSGETLCHAVIDGGSVQDHTVHFDSAVVRADSALWHAQRSGIDTLVTAAYGVRAQAKMNLGEWAGATADAAMVPTPFVYVAFFSDNSVREENPVYEGAHFGSSGTVWGTLAASYPEPGDPRAPWRDCTQLPAGCDRYRGRDQSSPFYQQNKYPEPGSDISVIKGTEMRLIEAEAFLEAGDVPNATITLNAARAAYGLGPLPEPPSVTDAWILLDNERHLTLWLEGRRWHDAHRWDDAGRSFMPAVRYLYGLTDHPAQMSHLLTKRGSCFLMSEQECAMNPNLSGVPECVGDYIGQ